MTLTRLPTEQTTAATDLAIAVIAVAAWWYLLQRGPAGLRGRLWRSVFVLLGLSGLLGAVAHGIDLDAARLVMLWRGTYLALSLLVAAFFLATMRDLFGNPAAARALPALLIIALGAFGLFLFDPDNFTPFILYETTAMLLSLVGYVWLAWRDTLAGAGWIALSVAVNIAAAAIQATGTLAFRIIWPFDHNGIFHLVQMLGMFLLVVGLAKGAEDRA